MHDANHDTESAGDSTTRPTTRATPKLSDDALYGLPGEVVRAIEPHTEADPVALLLTFLTMFGNAIGAGPHIDLGSSPQPGRLFTVLVGDTATGRKGTAGDEIEHLMETVDIKWHNDSITHGFQSAEGLVAAVDDIHGVRRLMWIESEFGRLIDTLNRRANMADHMKQAFDGKKLSIRTKHHSGWLTATHHHISVIGHVTPSILGDRMSATELASGFANRFLFAKVERSKLLSRPTRLSDSEFDELVDRICGALDWIKGVAYDKVDPISAELFHISDRVPTYTLGMSDDALDEWDKIYADLSTAEVGVIGEITARASTQVIRLALIYALADKSTLIRPVHLRAALAVWRYSDESVSMIFGSITGDRHVDRLLRELDSSPDKSLSKTQIFNVFARNVDRKKLETIIERLPYEGREVEYNGSLVWVTVETVNTGGRPARVFMLNKKDKEA